MDGRGRGELSEQSYTFGKFKCFVGKQLLPLFSVCPIILLWPPQMVCLWTRPYVHAHPSAKMDFSTVVSGGGLTWLIMVWCPLYTPGEAICTCVVSPLLHGWQRNNVTSWSFTSNRVCWPLSLPCYLRSVHRKQSPSIYPVPVVVSISKCRLWGCSNI